MSRLGQMSGIALSPSYLIVNHKQQKIATGCWLAGESEKSLCEEWLSHSSFDLCSWLTLWTQGSEKENRFQCQQDRSLR